MSSRSEEVDASNIFTAEYIYNSTTGKVSNIEINNDKQFDYLYNSNGYLYQIKHGQATIWNANSMNYFGIIDDFDLGDGSNNVVTYDQYGFLDRIQSVVNNNYIQDWDYDYNITLGNLTSREGLSSLGTYLEEQYTYDNQNRLLTYTIGSNTMEVEYDNSNFGNITYKTDAGDYSYDISKVHQINSISNASTFLSNLPDQNISYTEYNKVETILEANTESSKLITFTYGPNQVRAKTVFQNNDTVLLTKYYGLGMYEKEVDLINGDRELFSISTPSGISAILVSTSTYDSLFYIHTDNLGSFDVITDDQGNIRENLSFDPWGRRRNPEDWSYNNIPDDFIFDRGYTGHEHLDNFGLINMNGRVYDPLLAMFTSPDPYIQAPYITQNFNRYAYVLNNPIKWIDPSGNKKMPAPWIGNGVWYDDVEDRYIFYSEIIGREAEFFGHGYSAITTMPRYRSGGLIYKVDSSGKVEYGYYAKVSSSGDWDLSREGEIVESDATHLGDLTVLAKRPMWITVGTSRLSSDVDQSMFQYPLGRLNFTLEYVGSKPKTKKEKRDWSKTIEERLDIYDRQIQLNYYNDMLNTNYNGLGPTLNAFFQALFNRNPYDTLIIDNYLDEIRHYRDSLRYYDYWD